MLLVPSLRRICPFDQLAGDRIGDGFLEISACVVLPRRAAFTAFLQRRGVGRGDRLARRQPRTVRRELQHAALPRLAFGLASAFAGALAGLGLGTGTAPDRIGLQRDNDGPAGQQRGQQS
jgi:hypothetical protein